MVGFQKRARAWIAAALLALLGPSLADAQDPAAFYKGKTVHFMVGVGVGGGFDAYARMIAPYLAKELGATVIVENVIGGGGLLALNRIYGAQPDGLRLMIVNATPATLAQLLGRENQQYDMMKFAHLGIISAYPWVWIAGHKSGIDDVNALISSGRELRWAGTAPADGPGDGAAITCFALKLKCRIVFGYRSSSEMALSIERGETDTMYISDSSGATYVRNGSAKPIAAMARNRSELLPETPTIYELVKLTPEQEWIFDFRGNLNDLGRLLVTTAGMPPDRLAHFRAAVKRALTDPALIAEGEKTQRYVKFQPHEEAEQIVRKVLVDITPEQRKLIQDAIR